MKAMLPTALVALLASLADLATGQVTDEPLTLVNPTSRARLWAAVLYPADAGADRQYPAVVMVPGGLGFGSRSVGAPEPYLIARAGFVVAYFDPDGRGRSQGEENYNGLVQQDGLHALLRRLAQLPQVKKDNIGIVSRSYGLALVAGTLGRFPDDPPVKYFIDVEGPSDRFYITVFDSPWALRIFNGHTSKEADWWAEREAVRTIRTARCAYLRIQYERDHVHKEKKQHALDMINAATDSRYGGKGRCPWTRINGPENEPNRTYTMKAPPQWLPVAARHRRVEETLRWIRQMAALEVKAGAPGRGSAPAPVPEFVCLNEQVLWLDGYADPSVVRMPGGRYLMYLNRFGPHGTGTFILSSTDGLSWQEATGIVFPGVAAGRAVRSGDGVRFYYPKPPRKARRRGEEPPRNIVSSFSPDGVTGWKYEGVRISPRDGYSVGGPTVIRLTDGTYRMFFDESPLASWRPGRVMLGTIYGASSDDGLTWTRDEAPTITFDQDVEGTATGHGASKPQVLHPCAVPWRGGKYLMFYNAHSRLFAALSPDGLKWQKLGYIGVRGADVDILPLPDGTLRIYYGRWGAGGVATAILRVRQ